MRIISFIDNLPQYEEELKRLLRVVDMSLQYVRDEETAKLFQRRKYIIQTLLSLIEEVR